MKSTLSPISRERSTLRRFSFLATDPQLAFIRHFQKLGWISPSPGPGRPPPFLAASNDGRTRVFLRLFRLRDGRFHKLQSTGFVSVLALRAWTALSLYALPLPFSQPSNCRLHDSQECPAPIASLPMRWRRPSLPLQLCECISRYTFFKTFSRLCLFLGVCLPLSCFLCDCVCAWAIDACTSCHPVESTYLAATPSPMSVAPISILRYDYPPRLVTVQVTLATWLSKKTSNRKSASFIVMQLLAGASACPPTVILSVGV